MGRHQMGKRMQAGACRRKVLWKAPSQTGLWRGAKVHGNQTSENRFRPCFSLWLVLVCATLPEIVMEVDGMPPLHNNFPLQTGGGRSTSKVISGSAA